LSRAVWWVSQKVALKAVRMVASQVAQRVDDWAAQTDGMMAGDSAVQTADWWDKWEPEWQQAQL
jgi:hypothetical protein